MAIDKRFEMMDDDLENIAGGRTYGYGTNFYMTVQTNQSYLPLLATPEKNSANELSKLYTGDQVELVMPYDTTYLYVFDMKTGQYGYVEGNSLVDPRTGKNRHISVNGKTKKEVVDKLREIEMSMLTGTGNYHGECRMTMDQWFQEWLEKYMVNIKSSTRDNYEQKIRLYLSPAMGKVKLKDLSTHMIQSIISEYVNPTLRTTPDLSAKSIKERTPGPSILLPRKN